MTERGMIFNGEMVRALLDGRKTQTRRIMAVQPDSPEFGLLRIVESTARCEVGKYNWSESNACGNHIRSKLFTCPFGQPGDHLWVREKFFPAPLEVQSSPPRATMWNIIYSGGEQLEKLAPPTYNPTIYNYERWTPSIHMPRWASRITLEITNIGVQRLQSISQNDAAREGLLKLPATGRYCINQGDQYFGGASHDAREVFSWLWQSIYGEESWQANPWGWVSQFRRVDGGAL